MPAIINNDIFTRYMDNFSLLNDAEHREYFKREMVQHFKDTWNPHSEDYPSMLKESIQKQSSVFLDDRYNCPANGMVKLASHPEALEEVKALFEMLFSDDAGDLDKRQSRIENFVDRCNELLDIYEPGKWKYKQSFRTCLNYYLLNYQG